MTRTRASDRPNVRLLWDEDASRSVARALRALGLRVTWIGADDHGVPDKGATDEEVIVFAQQTNQIIVTKNHDMMMLCDEAGQRFVWIDSRGKSLPRERQVIIAFTQIRDWQRILLGDDHSCVRALRTGARPIVSAEAARLARQRFKAIERKRRSARRKKMADQQLLHDD
ncbi:DUF5615 family PIN-like protein [Ilumatobacter sp.]|uniref:DUF5615 family PIN-like protein n=1 Tax=Ilumatobacter sp. TaxID=1967498 RepID=UPI003B51C1D6